MKVEHSLRTWYAKELKRIALDADTNGDGFLEYTEEQRARDRAQLRYKDTFKFYDEPNYKTDFSITYADEEEERQIFASESPFRHRGQVVPNESICIVELSYFPEYVGGGLRSWFAFDRRNGEFVGHIVTTEYAQI